MQSILDIKNEISQQLNNQQKELYTLTSIIIWIEKQVTSFITSQANERIDFQSEYSHFNYDDEINPKANFLKKIISI